MPRDLFGDVTRPSISIGNRKWYTLPLSLFSHSAIVLLLVAIPILAPAVMPSVFADAELTLITTKLPTPPPPPAPRTIEQPRVIENPNAAPVSAPDKINPEREIIETPEHNVPGIIGGDPNVEGVLTPPPAPVAKPPETQKPLQVGGTIRRPVKIGGNDPVYPAMARVAGVQGMVIIEATIAADGHVMNARILRSLPLLDQAALEAVRQWQYTPTLLNGVPVPVVMTVTVTFTLSR
jgi:protein TonB